jgi:hypothetical protein
MTQSGFDMRIQQESRNPIVDDDIKAERRLLRHRLRRILKAEERDAKHYEFHTTNKKITIQHKDQNPTNNHLENLQVLYNFCQQERS